MSKSLALLALFAFVVAGCNQGSSLTGLKIVDISKGDGGEFDHKAPVKNGDRAYVLYTGKLADGTVFDSNEQTGQKVFSFTVGGGEVIKGWDQGLLGMVVGGERNISVPPSLGYGNQDNGKIPANSDLFFHIKLMDVIPAGGEADVLTDDLKKGDGPEAGPGKKVTISYTINDLKGGEIDSNDLTWTIGTDKVYPAIELGLKGMRQGGIRVLRLGPGAAIQEYTAGIKPPSLDLVQILRVKLVKVE